MENKLDSLEKQLIKCCNLIKNGYKSPNIVHMRWLNDFCADCLKVADIVHSYVTDDLDKKHSVDENDPVETMFLCLLQIVCCIKHMERVINAEEASGSCLVISASRQHFFDRIHFCLQRMRECGRSLAALGDSDYIKPLEDQTFVQHLDLLFDYISPYSAEMDSSDSLKTNVEEENAEAMCASSQIRLLIDLLLSHTLAFANVAIEEDKKAISALCQKVMRECNAFQEECSVNRPGGFKINDCNRKLKALCLENAIRQLEAFINEALLRLLFVCFLDFEKFSVEKLRLAIHTNSTKPNVDDTVVDELIADFDVNIDRSIQIGVFAIAFAPNMKMKTIVRSCLASFESLDTHLVPSLQSNTSFHSMHSELLEQHFNEEVVAFKKLLQNIVESSAFVGCYLELLTNCICKNEKKFQKNILQEILHMGEFVHEHFQLKVNRKLLYKRHYPQRLEYFQQFLDMLHECKAILSCANQVDPQRIIKRFKILRNVVRKLQNSLNENSYKSVQKHNSDDNMYIMNDESPTDQQNLLDSFDINPSVCSILYSNEIMESRRRLRAASDSLKVNYMKTPNNKKFEDMLKNDSTMKPGPQVKLNNLQRTSYQNPNGFLAEPSQVLIKRKPSLRTTMFKKLNIAESEKQYNAYKRETANLQIADIVDQFTYYSKKLGKNSRSIEVIASI